MCLGLYSGKVDFQETGYHFIQCLTDCLGRNELIGIDQTGHADEDTADVGGKNPVPYLTGNRAGSLSTLIRTFF